MQKILSVFIDESGDFGKYDPEAPYYLITMVFHEQIYSIVKEMEVLASNLRNQGLLYHSLHTGPLIRKEEVYKTLNIDQRKKIFNSFISFTKKVNITYKTFILKKRPKDNATKIAISLSQLLQDYLSSKEEIWRKYDQIVVYYDNGQIQLTHIIEAVFEDSRTIFRTVKPYNYRLFQVADLLTTLELINLKKENNLNSKSELLFFGSMRNFYKNYYRYIEKKKDE
ncbi:MAG: DUF3800 domain-containing protein [Clostridia bacterium]|nr:DUF3800 domain-containing protein [Clostridia bacterium]